MQGLTSLVTFNWYDSGLTDEQAALLVRARRLRWLLLGKCRLTDKGLSDLAQLPELDTLQCKDAEITEAFYTALLEAPSLSVLRLEGVYLSEEALTTLAAHPTLDTVVIKRWHGEISYQALVSCREKATVGLHILPFPEFPSIEEFQR
jgi:hypothetical protein